MNSIVKLMKMKQITYKLFMTTSLILLSFCSIDLFNFILLSPTFYEQYKTDQLQTGINEIIDKSKNLTFQDAIPLLMNTQKNNAMLYLQNKEGVIIYSPSFSFIQSGTQKQ